jgi:hypothetical protein
MIAYFRANVSVDFSNRSIFGRLPASFIFDSREGNEYSVRSNSSIPIASLSDFTLSDISNLAILQQELRKDLFYINGTQTLWYIKAKTSGPKILARFTPTITLAAMYRLSELCRYKPLELTSFLAGQKNWLLTEFIQQSPLQFFDEIAAEITGHQFLTPNVRAAT